MASNTFASTALLFTFNILFFTLVSSTSVPCPRAPPSKTSQKHPQQKATYCPKDTLKLGACAKLFSEFGHLVVGSPPKTPCCSLFGGLVDLEAAACLCTVIKANVLGRNINIPITLTLLLDYCGKKLPSGFKCA